MIKDNRYGGKKTVKECRNQMRAVPKNFNQYMTLEQQIVLFALGALGWRLNFIRRSRLQQPMVVLRGRRDHNTIGVLERDGHINTSPALTLRH